MLLPENPTILQMKNELSHYLDFKELGYESFVELGRPGREALVLQRLQQNRSWNEFNAGEQAFSINYVERLLDSIKGYTP